MFESCLDIGIMSCWMRYDIYSIDILQKQAVIIGDKGNRIRHLFAAMLAVTADADYFHSIDIFTFPYKFVNNCRIANNTKPQFVFL